MKLNKVEIENRKGYCIISGETDMGVVALDLIDTIEALHVNIEALAKQYEDQGRIAEANEIRRLEG